MRLIFVLILLISSPLYASKELYKKYKPAVVKITVTKHEKEVSGGTGFFFGPDGVIVTNAHVVESSIGPYSELHIKTSDGKEITNFQMNDCVKKDIDLCFIKTNIKPTSYFKPKIMDFELGEKIYVIGHSLGLDYTISDGLVSGKRDFKDIDKSSKIKIALFQISAPISPGNSGGPAFDEKGNLVGVSTFIYGGKKLGQNLNFTISNKEVISRYNKLASEKFYTFKEYSKKAEQGAYKKLDNTVAKLNSLLNKMRKEKVNFKKSKPTIALKSTSSNFAIQSYVPKDFMKCKGQMGIYVCKVDYLKSFTYMLSNKDRFTTFLKDLRKSDGKPNSAYKAAKKLKDNKKLQAVLVKEKESFIQRYKSLGCRDVPSAFNNSKKSTKVCKHLFKNVSMPGSSLMISEVQADSENYITLVSEYYNPKLEKLSDTFTELAMAFTEVGFVKASDKSNQKLTRQQRRQLRKQRRAERNKVYKTSLEGIVTETTYSNSSQRLKVSIKVDDVAEYTFRVNVNGLDYMQPKILPGDVVKIDFEDKMRRIEMGLRTKSFRPEFFKITNKTKRSASAFDYRVRYNYVRDDYASMSVEKDGDSFSVRFYGAAFEELKKLNIQKNDLVSLAIPDLISYKNLTFLREGQIKVIGTAKSSPRVTTRSKRSSTPRAVRTSSRSRRSSKGGMKSGSFRGVISKLQYLRKYDKVSIELDTSHGTMKFSLKNSNDRSRLSSLPPLSKGDEIEVSVQLESRDFERKMNKLYFILDPEEFTVKALKTSGQLHSGVSGKVSYVKDYDEYYYMSLKTDAGRRVVNVYHPEGVKVLRKINFKKGDMVKFGPPDYLEKNKNFIYTYSFEMLDHRAN